MKTTNEIKSGVLLLCFILFPLSVSAVDITTAGKQFRDDIQLFLTQEGFSPYVDEDGSLCFKQEGNLFWINVIGDKPYYVQFHREGFAAEDVDEVALLRAINEVNTSVRAIKCCFYNQVVSLGIESYCHLSEDFKYVFYSYLNILNHSYDELKNQYEHFYVKTSLPIYISSIDMGITDENNKLITPYGYTLFSRSTKYLKPRISSNAKTAGTYDIYCKFYDANGNLSTGPNSPNGYTWKNTIYMSQGDNMYVLSGWGSANSGQWAPGRYRIELYYQDSLLISKSFTIN